DARRAAQKKAGLPGELLHGGAQRLHPIAQVGAEPDERVDHRGSARPSITPPPSGIAAARDSRARALPPSNSPPSDALAPAPPARSSPPDSRRAPAPRTPATPPSA